MGSIAARLSSRRGPVAAERMETLKAGPLVALFGAPEETGDVAAALGKLNFAVDLRHDNDIHPLPLERRPAAAIVVEGIEDRLDLCAALARDYAVILISPRSGFDFRLAASRSGVSAVLRPPLNPIELSEWLTHFGLHDGLVAQTAVVIIDDDQLTSEINAEVLRSAGMAVDVVCEPALALEAIERRLPDLVLMDMQMPMVSGLELAKVIRQCRQFASLPIVFLSAERNEDLQFQARMLGGDDFIAKAIDPHKLISVVRMRAERSRLVRSMIERDGLTGLYDHRRFRERLTQELERCRRIGANLCLAMVDIDRFKAVNDVHGHAIGDVVIRTLAISLTSGVRQVDVVGRYGGEEFGIILLDTDPQSARTVIDRIRHRFSQSPIRAASASFNVTFSAGVASCDEHRDIGSLIDAADKALYRAKAGGRNRIECSNDTTTYAKAPSPLRTPGHKTRDRADRAPVP